METSKVKTTTVSVDAVARNYINSEADKLGLSQRQMVHRLIESYSAQQNMDENTNIDKDEVIKDIYTTLVKVLKRDDRVISFIKEQEKILLNPILKVTQTTEANLNQLIEILSNLS